MGLILPKPPQPPQNVLPFDYDTTGSAADITARGGLPLVLEIMRALRLDEAIGSHLEIRKRKSGFSEVEHVEALVLLVASGGECLDDMKTLGMDRALLRLLSKAKLPSPDATREFLHAFHDEALLEKARAAAIEAKEKSFVPQENKHLAGLFRVNEHLVRSVNQQRAARMATLEGDGTIIESRKQEAEPHYKGGRGYQPVIVYWVEQDLIVGDEFRDGNVPAGKRPLDVVRRAFAALPSSIEERRFRADSAWYEEEALKWLSDPENRIRRFTVSADMSEPLQALCRKASGWKLFEERANETVFFTEVEFVTGNWKKDAKPLRTLALKIERHQGELFDSERRTKYLAIVSNDFAEEGAKLIRWHHAKAGKIEIGHDVMKNELGAGVLPCGAFGANAAWFRLNVITYNVLSALKTIALPPTFADARPKRLRFGVFALPARVILHARRLTARVASVFAELFDLGATRARIAGALAAAAPSG